MVLVAVINRSEIVFCGFSFLDSVDSRMWQLREEILLDGYLL